MGKKTPTQKQKKAAKAIVENLMKDKPEPAGKVLKNVGYKSIGDNPGRIMEMLGFKLAMRELGLTEELIATSLVSDINNKPQKRVKELSLGAEILGMKKKEEEPQQKTGNIYNIFFNAKTQEELKLLEDKIKERLKNVKHIS